MTNAGRFGIGTTAPTCKLQVYDGTGTTTSTTQIIQNDNFGTTAANCAGSQWVSYYQTTPRVTLAAYNLAGAGSTYQYIPLYLQGNPVIFQVGNVAIGLTTAAYQLDLSTDGARKLTSPAWLTGSDVRIKTDIETANLQRCYDIVNAVDLKYFKWNFPPESNVKLGDEHSLGFIAQEVQTVFPKAVSSSNSYGYSDFRSLDVDQLNKALFGAVKYLSTENTKLRAELTSLAARLDVLESKIL
jgi:hypothetical protein